MGGERAGFALLVLAAFAFSTLGPLTRTAYEGGGTPLSVLAIRYTVAALLLWAGRRLAGAPTRQPAPRTVRLLALGVLYAASAYGLFVAFQSLPLGLTILLFYTYPLWVTLFSWALGERVGRGRWLALGSALAGLVLIVGFQGGALDARGVVGALAAALLIAAFLVASGRLMRGSPPLVVLAHVLLGAAGVYGGLAVASGVSLALTPVAWAAALAVAVVPTVLALGAMLGGVARLGAGRAVIVSALEPVLATVWGAVLYGERLSALQLVGGLLVVVALVLNARRPS